MKRIAFIFHGTQGYPEENWFPWLKTELNQLGFFVIVPQFPTPENQSLSHWLRVMEPHLPLVNDETVLIGHSVGGIFALRLLEQLTAPINAACLVGSYIGLDGVRGYDLSDEELFLQTPFNWKKINQNCRNRLVYHSDNDPNVTLNNGNALAEHLDSKLRFLPGRGHFNAASDTFQFPELRDDICNLNKPKSSAQAA